MKYLLEIRWNNSPICPHCGSDRYYVLSQKYNYKCANNDCHKKFNILTRTIFENSKIALPIWFTAIYIAASHKKGISSLQLSRDLGITQKSAWFMLHRIRAMFSDRGIEVFTTEIEIDETYIGGKTTNKHKNKRLKNTQGRSTKDKTAVIGLLERNGKVFSTPVKNGSRNVLLPIIAAKVQPGATIYTDEYAGYTGLNGVYLHSIVRHGQGNYVNGRCHTNTIENFWSLLKRGIYGIYHQTSAKHLHRYCSEFAFRYNSKDISQEERFIMALRICDIRLKYIDLIGAKFI